jgi:alpha-glucosidase
MLSLYRVGLHLRRALPELGDGALEWLPSADGVLAFGRGERFACVVNFGRDAVELPAGRVLVASSELEGGAVPPDTTVWLSQANG